MYKPILTALAVFGQFLALFPFIVTAECVGFGEPCWWHYFAMYGGFAAFYLCGRLLSCWANGGGFSRKVKPFVMFVSRAGVIVPTGGFLHCRRYSRCAFRAVHVLSARSDSGVFRRLSLCRQGLQRDIHPGVVRGILYCGGAIRTAYRIYP